MSGIGVVKTANRWLCAADAESEHADFCIICPLKRPSDEDAESRFPVRKASLALF